MNNLLIDRLPQLLNLVEEWRPIKDYEDFYEVSSTGKVRSLDRVTSHGHRRKGREMKTVRQKSGYFRVVLTRDGKASNHKVHRLVVEAFRGEIAEGLVVRHISDDPDLNLLPMLEAGSHRDNVADKVSNGRCYLTEMNGSKTQCSRGHDITSPLNLRSSKLKRGGRECLACHRASNHNYNRKIGLDKNSEEFQALSDEYYRATLAGFTSPAKFYKAIADTVTT